MHTFECLGLLKLDIAWGHRRSKSGPNRNNTFYITNQAEFTECVKNVNVQTYAP
jgi:hypothetical protein